MRVVLFIFFVLILAACHSSKKTAVIADSQTATAVTEKNISAKNVQDTAKKDTTDLQKNYQWLMGKWQISVVQVSAENDKLNLNNAWLEFRNDNTLSGSGGCNSFSGSFKLINNNISLRNLLSTQMACNNMTGEAQLMKYLSGMVRTITFYGKNELWLKDGGSGMVICQRM
jgi:heat shock protein HslJ